MSFAIYSIGSSCCAQLRAEEHSLLSTGQIITGVVDLILLSGLVVWGSLILANNAQSIHLPGLASFTNQTAYILLGTAGFIFAIDLIAMAVQAAKKFKALADKIKEETKPAVQLLEPTDDQKELKAEKQKTKLLEQQLKNAQKQKADIEIEVAELRADQQKKQQAIVTIGAENQKRLTALNSTQSLLDQEKLKTQNLEQQLFDLKQEKVISKPEQAPETPQASQSPEKEPVNEQKTSTPGVVAEEARQEFFDPNDLLMIQ